jgi:hypothetical protein
MHFIQQYPEMPSDLTLTIKKEFHGTDILSLFLKKKIQTLRILFIG